MPFAADDKTPRDLAASTHGEALALMDTTAALRSVIVLTGQSGTGKSAVLKTSMTGLDPKRHLPLLITQIFTLSLRRAPATPSERGFPRSQRENPRDKNPAIIVTRYTTRSPDLERDIFAPASLDLLAEASQGIPRTPTPSSKGSVSVRGRPSELSGGGAPALAEIGDGIRPIHRGDKAAFGA